MKALGRGEGRPGIGVQNPPEEKGIVIKNSMLWVGIPTGKIPRGRANYAVLFVFTDYSLA